jgi:hypothetical protein
MKLRQFKKIENPDFQKTSRQYTDLTSWLNPLCPEKKIEISAPMLHPGAL